MTPLPTASPPLVQLSARERIYQALRGWIVEGVLEPDEQLRDSEVAERFGTSRTPVREALRQLEDERLVTTARNRWTRVAPIDPEETALLLPILSSLEALGLRMAWPLSEDEVAALEEANDAVARAVEDQRAKRAFDADLRFHAIFDGSSGNPELVATVGRLRDRIRRSDLAYWSQPAAEVRESIEEHTRIIDAIKSGDLEGAVHAIDDHLHHPRQLRETEAP